MNSLHRHILSRCLGVLSFSVAILLVAASAGLASPEAIDDARVSQFMADLQTAGVNGADILAAVEALSVFYPELPIIAEARASSAFDDHIKCATMAFGDLVKRSHEWPSPLKDELFAIVENSITLGDQVHTTDHFKIHYTLTGDDATTPEYAERVGDYFEAARSVENIAYGYLGASSGPLSPRYIVNIEDLTSDGVTMPDLPWVDGSSRISIDVGDTDDVNLMDSVAHEYHHACTNRYVLIFALLAKDWVVEGSAVWMANEVVGANHPDHYPDNYFIRQYEAGNWSPETSLATKDYDACGYWFFLAENTAYNFSGSGVQESVLRKCWEELAAHSWADITGAINDALALAGDEYDSLEDSYRWFAESMYFTNHWFQGIPRIDAVEAESVVLSESNEERTIRGDSNPPRIEEYGSTYFALAVDGQSKVNIDFNADPALQFVYPEIQIVVFEGGDYSRRVVVPVNHGKANITVAGNGTVVVVKRTEDGDLFWTPDGTYTVVFKRLPVESTIAAMDFEDGTDGQVIRSTIPGMFFTTTQGYDWIYGDKTTGRYNVYPYGSGDYVCNGNFFAWLGPNQGAGRITFIGDTARNVSLKTSSNSGLYLKAYDADDRLIDIDHAGGNTGTGTLSTLSVSGENIAYVLAHDSGNYWLVDDLVVEDLLRSTTAYLGDDFGAALEDLALIDQGEQHSYTVDVTGGVDLELILNWGGSELSLEAIAPDGETWGYWRSAHPPIVARVENAAPGTWSFNVVAHDVPNADYPFAMVVGASEPPSDDTPPVVTINSPVPGGRHSDYLPLLFEYQAEDPESDIIALEGRLDGAQAIASGDLVLVDAGANHEFVVTATNSAGQTTTASVQFSVMDFEWGDPLGLPEREVAFVSAANRTIPVKFSLHEGDSTFVVSDDVRIVLEDTPVDFVTCDGTSRADLCVRLDDEDGDAKYIVNLHTNPSRYEYGLAAGDMYTLKAFVDGMLVGSKEIVFPSFAVASAVPDQSFGFGETLSVQWDLPEGVTATACDILLSVDGGRGWTLVGSPCGDARSYDIVYPDAEFTTAQVQVVAKSSIGVIHGLSPEFTDSALSGVEEGLPRAAFALEQNTPNPFNPSTIIKFSLAQADAVRLVVFDVSGRKVRTLLDGERLRPGPQQASWDGTDEDGRSVPAGVYFCLLQAGESSLTRRMALVK